MSDTKNMCPICKKEYTTGCSWGPCKLANKLAQEKKK